MSYITVPFFILIKFFPSVSFKFSITFTSIPYLNLIFLCIDSELDSDKVIHSENLNVTAEIPEYSS